MIGMSFHVCTNAFFSRYTKIWFVCAFLGIALGAAAEYFGTFLNVHTMPPAVHTVVTLTEFCVTPTIPVLISFACGIKRPAIPVGIFLLIHIIVEFVCLPGGRIFYIDADGIYHRGTLYEFYIASYVVSFAYLMFMFLFLSRRFRNRDIMTLGFALFSGLAGLIPSLVDGQIKTAFLGMTMMTIILYEYYEGLTAQDLSEELTRKNERIQTMQAGTILGMAMLIESRDQSTGEHVKNTAEYARILARAAYREGLYPEIINDRFVELMEQAAPMHDIGKIAVPDAILQKPDRLTEEEIQTMNTHAAEGGKLIQKVLSDITDEDYTRIASEVANYHHEKWDGSGYPNGLSGNQIPVSARIMAIADVYDALTMERVYKKAMPPEQALEIIGQGAGTHFDPVLAPLFVRVMRERLSGTSQKMHSSPNEKTETGKRPSKKKIILIAACAVAAAVLLMLWVLFRLPLTEEVSPKQTDTSADWMSALPDDALLSSLSLPGTHDSATVHVEMPYFLRCQALKLDEQLLAGFRYLDIRIRTDGDRLVLCHNFADCRTGDGSNAEKLDLETALAPIYLFLDEHPEETVVFSVKAEKSGEDIPLLQTLLKKSTDLQPDRWLLTDRIPTLGEARGKIVLLRRYEDEAALGTAAGIYIAWEEQGSYIDPKKAVAEENCGGLTIYVQDRFRYPVKEKLEAVNMGLLSADQKDNSELSLNFTNTIGAVGISHPYSMAKRINRCFDEWEIQGNTGWMIVDFGNAHIAEIIYGTNDGKAL